MQKQHLGIRFSLRAQCSCCLLSFRFQKDDASRLVLLRLGDIMTTICS